MSSLLIKRSISNQQYTISCLISNKRFYSNTTIKLQTNNKNNNHNITNDDIKNNNDHIIDIKTAQLTSTQAKLQREQLTKQLQYLESLQYNEINGNNKNNKSQNNTRNNKVKWSVITIISGIISLSLSYKLWQNKQIYNDKYMSYNQQIDTLNKQNQHYDANSNILQDKYNVTNDVLEHYTKSAINKHDNELYNALQMIKQQINRSSTVQKQ